MRLLRISFLLCVLLIRHIHLFIRVFGVGGDDGEGRSEDFTDIKVKDFAVFPDMCFQFLEVVLRRLSCGYLTGENNVFAVTSEKNFSAVHTRAGEIAYDSVLVFKVENDYYSARLVFAEEAARCSADYHKRDLFFVFLHVNTRSVTRVAPDIDFSAAHCIARRVAYVSVDYNHSVVHRVADSVLSVAVNSYLGAVEVCAQSIARHAVNDNFLF